MNRIKELRKRDNVKQADLAKSVNVSQAALSGYETGKYEADTDTYRRIANYFDVSLDYLLGGQPATPARPGYMLVNGDDATVKRIKKSPQGVTLIPSNPAYEPMYYSNEEIESLPVQILGRVVELRAKL